MTRAAIGLVLLCAPLIAAAEESEHDRLAGGEIIITTNKIEGSDMPEVVVHAVLNAAPQKVWAIIEQCGKYKDTMPRIKESKELSRNGTTVRCDVTLDSPGPLKDLRSITVATHTVTADRWVRAWKLEDGDYKVNEGSWTLTKFDGNADRTYAEYRFHSEPKIWIPAWGQQFAIKHALPGIIEKLRGEVK